MPAKFKVGDLVVTNYDSEGPLSLQREAKIIGIERWNVLLDGPGFCCWVRKEHVWPADNLVDQ